MDFASHGRSGYQILNHYAETYMKKLSNILFALLLTGMLGAQNIPESMDYTMLYDFLDELATDGVIHINSAIQPYSRNTIAALLREAQQKDSLLNQRQKDDLLFYMQDFALELDTIPDYRLYGHDNRAQWTDKRTFNLSLVEPAFHYKTDNNKFKMMIKPILGMDIYASKKGIITKRWYGAEVQMDIVGHVSIWGSLRDKSWKGTGLLNKDYFPDQYAQIDGSKITKGQYLNNLQGVQYKEANYGGDFSDSRGGISLYDWWGSISVQRENIRWGDAYHASNIISNHSPAFPMITLNLKPCRWFEFNYFHAWLVSNVLDSTYYYQERYTEGETRLHYRPANKFMAANMFTFSPIRQLSFSFGNSIVYSERNVQAAYFIPIAFYKSLDHLLTKGLGTENQNSQMFFTISTRNLKHLHVYASVFVDEFQFARLKKSNPEHNLVSYLVGFNWSGWPVRGLSLKGEFMRANSLTYDHSIPTLTYASNSYTLGHYMGANAQSVFAELQYKPVRGLALKLNYTCDTKFNAYDYVRGINSQIIAYKPFDERIWQNDVVGFNATYEIFNNCYAVIDFQFNHARAFAPSSARKAGEDRGWNADGTSRELSGDDLAAYYLNKYTPLYFQGKNFTFMCGLNFSF